MKKTRLAGILASFLLSQTAIADFNITGYNYGEENNVIINHTIEDFEDLSLVNGLAIDFFEGIDIPRTYSGALPRLFNPAEASSMYPLGGPFYHNTWDGSYALTNAGHGDHGGITGISPGDGNFWDQDVSMTVRFSFSTPKQSIGVGLANFQSNKTSHELWINGEPYGLLEDIQNWQTGTRIQNLYLFITATDGDTISSITIHNKSWGDGLVFDKLAMLDQSPSYNNPPKAVAGSTSNPEGAIFLNASASSDPDGDLLSYSWTIPSEPSPRLGEIVSITDLEPGNYNVTLTVDDGKDGSDSDSLLFYVPVPGGCSEEELIAAYNEGKADGIAIGDAAGYTRGYEAGITFCLENPAACRKNNPRKPKTPPGKP